MKILFNKLSAEKYIETKEKNILVSNIINDYLENFAHFEHLNAFDNASLYENILEDLEIDKDDKDFHNLSKEYKLNEINELDFQKYSSNPYMESIKNINLKDTDYELINDFYYPYETFIYKDIEVDENEYFKEINKLGFFKEKFNFLALKDQKATWMSIIPHEIETMEEDIKKVNGKVMILGLGLGYFPYMISLKEDVKEIVIIEREKEIIDLFKENILPLFPNKNKIKILKNDAFLALNSNNLNFDYVYCDLYHDPFDALNIYQKMKNIEKNFPKTKFLYWIEKDILCLIRRYILTLVEESFLNYQDKDYLNPKTPEDKFLSKLYFKTKNLKINDEKDFKEFLKDENLKELVLD